MILAHLSFVILFECYIDYFVESTGFAPSTAANIPIVTRPTATQPSKLIGSPRKISADIAAVAGTAAVIVVVMVAPKAATARV